MANGPKDITVVLATDCGSTTTKAVLFEKKEDGWHQTFRGEAPTTVEKPVADVTIGARNAFLEIQELSGRKILRDDADRDPESCPILIRTDPSAKDGVDLYVSTSSAGGGLQMIVAGVVGTMTTESAERAALGAGAIVMDAISIDDGRQQHERVSRIRHLRPDIVLIAGGTDGGTIDHPLELAETVLQADPRPRFGETLKLPVIYAANKNAREQAQKILESRFAFTAVENIRPTLEKENLAPAREAIHEVFLHHVMSHAPGYKRLLSWSPVPVIPTPAAVGDMVQAASTQFNKQILAADIGGATTDVFSVFRSAEDQPFVFNRTVSANLGMSYSVANVMLEAGIENICRWLPFSLSTAEVQDRLRNKMIRPTTIPQALEDLVLEQAVCREALRLAFLHHKRLAVGLSGVKRSRTIGDLFRQGTELSLVDMMTLDLIIGSGGVLSHAPDRKSSALMMIDAYEPTGVTELAVDSIFMMPHLGVFSKVNAPAAAEIFVRDCLVPLGEVVAPTGSAQSGTPILEVELSGGEKLTLRAGELIRRPLAVGESLEMELRPLTRTADVGAGPGAKRTVTVRGGHAGIIFDGRGRPIALPRDSKQRIKLIQSWYRALELELAE
ncbi:MAG: glutamate mutase L [Bdellovibrionota bacterium]